jgi:hypothetical protein
MLLCVTSLRSASCLLAGGAVLGVSFFADWLLGALLVVIAWFIVLVSVWVPLSFVSVLFG